MRACAAIGLPPWVCGTSVNACLAAGLGFLIGGNAAACVAAVLALAIPFVPAACRAITAIAAFVVELFYLTLLEATLGVVALAAVVGARTRRSRAWKRVVRFRRRRA